MKPIKNNDFILGQVLSASKLTLSSVHFLTLINNRPNSYFLALTVPPRTQTTWIRNFKILTHFKKRYQRLL